MYDLDAIHALGYFRQPVKVHLKVNTDTGMNRQGIRPDEVLHYINVIKSCSNIEFEGIYSHIADADGETDDFMVITQ